MSAKALCLTVRKDESVFIEAGNEVIQVILSKTGSVSRIIFVAKESVNIWREKVYMQRKAKGES